MERKSVVSSFIKSVGYDEKRHCLEVEFKNGTVWEYDDVTAETYKEFIDSESVGKYFLSRIKKNFNGSKVS